MLRQFAGLLEADGFVRRGPVLETAAPAIVLSVFDSDCAWATAAGPSGDTVEFHLDTEILGALSDGGDDRFEPLDSQAVAGLVAWAENAGLVADVGRLAAALEASPGPSGDGILEFAAALGSLNSAVVSRLGRRPGNWPPASCARVWTAAAARRPRPGSRPARPPGAVRPG